MSFFADGVEENCLKPDFHNLRQPAGEEQREAMVQAPDLGGIGRYQADRGFDRGENDIQT